MKKILTLALLFVSMLAIAVPAKPGIIKVSQPDGTILEILLTGDENFNYATTSDGYLIKQSEDGYYKYAEYKDCKIVATERIARNVVERQRADISYLNKIGKAELKKEQLDENWQDAVTERMQMAPNQSLQSSANSDYPTKGLVILVQFSDVSFYYGMQDFDNLLNQEGYSNDGATGSANEYFKSVSNGQYDPHFDVYGPVTLDHNMKYYGENSVSTDGDIRSAQMFVDAVAKLKSNPNISIDLSDYDSNNDGYVDNVFLFYAGYSEAEGASSNAIWPHSWVVYSYDGSSNYEGNISYDGVELSSYACTSELRGTYGTTKAAIGPFCHEFSHVLGLPDFYATNSSQHKTCGEWDIMDAGSYNNNSNTPPSYSAHERFYLGWLTPTVINLSDTFQLSDIKTSNKAYMITATGSHNLNPEKPNPSEYYLLENRQLTGWDAYLPGGGMLITKTSYNKKKWTYNSVNNDSDNQGYDIIEADGLDSDQYYYGKAGDLFPGSSNVTSYAPYQSFVLSNIAESNGLISFVLTGNETHLVTFDAREYGSANVSSLKELVIGGGVTLPGVAVSDDEYTLIGWSENSRATEADAGLKGEVYYPTEDKTLYAVYVKDGEIVGFDGDRLCFEESFDNLSAYNTDDIASELDDYCDNRGWFAKNVSRYNGSIRIGSLVSTGGYILTPRLYYNTNITVTVVAKAKTSDILTISVEGTDIVKTIDLSTTEDEYSVDFENMELLSRLKFSSTSGQLLINYISICAEGTSVAVEDVKDADAINLLYGDNRMRILENLQVGATVQCFDVAGRMLWREKASSTQMNFIAPDGFYIIRVVCLDNKSAIIKGL